MQADDDADAVHERFLGIAEAVSEPLAHALAAVGPAPFPDRGDVPLAHFLARAVVGQQLSTQAARSIWARVEAAASAAGGRIPEFLDADCYETLRACGLSRNKIRTLAHIREAAREGRLDGAALRALDHEERSRALCAIWGVGRWTADMASIFHCRSPDVWPETDVAVQRTFARLIGRRRRPAKWAARFAPHRSWLALYMWRITDAVPE